MINREFYMAERELLCFFISDHWASSHVIFTINMWEKKIQQLPLTYARFHYSEINTPDFSESWYLRFFLLKHSAPIYSVGLPLHNIMAYFTMFVYIHSFTFMNAVHVFIYTSWCMGYLYILALAQKLHSNNDMSNLWGVMESMFFNCHMI